MLGTGEERTAEVTDDAPRRKRQVGTIQFPYADLDDAVGVAKVVWSKAGMSSMQVDQLAANMGHDTAKSGAFRSKLGAARLFGFINTAGLSVSLTSQGRRAASEQREQTARACAEAFLSVPLYKLVYERHRGERLPDDAGLEQELVELGVAPNQRERARQVLQRSAQQAGFFAQGRHRLVPPSLMMESETSEPQAPEAEVPMSSTAVESRESDDDVSRFHTMVRGLVGELPSAGQEWPAEDLERWLTTARVVLTYAHVPKDQHQPDRPDASPPGDDSTKPEQPF